MRPGRSLVLLSLLGPLACAPSTRPEPVAGGDPGPKLPAGSSPALESAPPGAPRELLEAHNALRARHCAPPLSWSRELARTAQAWAEGLARRGCPLEHSGGELGENLASATIGTMRHQAVVELWYGERVRYNFAQGGFSARTGHFTQLVWRGSARLGCGVAACPELQLWVCNYDPPGNVMGQFAANVRPTSCRR